MKVNIKQVFRESLTGRIFIPSGHFSGLIAAAAQNSFCCRAASGSFVFLKTCIKDSAPGRFSTAAKDSVFLDYFPTSRIYTAISALLNKTFYSTKGCFKKSGIFIFMGPLGRQIKEDPLGSSGLMIFSAVLANTTLALILGTHFSAAAVVTRILLLLFSFLLIPSHVRWQNLTEGSFLARFLRNLVEN
ncbi:MAG: hypothetical protein PHS09_07025 [Candidatus Omnitrophica bacterium]|nr:hypothetical protein [Candidatus Omnitrophota bacterium]